ncbi:MAG: AI-2E family transporter [Bacteroidales bacterium]|nr:AI-2E family transporter [Bacteroidales bacterium]
MEKYKKYIVGLIGLVLLSLFLIYFTDVIAWILISAFIAMLGNPIVEFIRKFHIGKFHVPTWVASMITIVMMYTVVIIGFSLLLPLVVNQINEFQSIDIETVSEGLEKPIKSIDDFIQKTPIINQPGFSTEDYVLEKISSVINFTTVGKFVNDLGGTAINLLMSLFVITFTSFFFLKDKDLFDKGVLMIVPTKYEEKTKKVLASIRKLIARYLFGMILETSLMVLLYTLGLYLIGVEFSLALLIGLICGVLNVIPYIGPWIVASIGLVLFITANIQLDFSAEVVPMIIKILVVIGVVKLIDDSVFQPFIYSKSVKAHPLEIFFVIIVAGHMYGVLGMMLAIPGYTVIRVIAREFLYQYKFIQQLTQGMNTQEAVVTDEKLEIVEDKPENENQENGNL